MTAKEIAAEINSEWWKSSSEETFTEAAQELLDAGWKPKRVLSFLSGLHCACADEYGD